MPATRTCEVTLDACDELVTMLADAATTGRGWVNVQPIAADEQPAERSGMFGILGPRIPDLALGTWTPPDARRADGPAQVGIQHPYPSKARPILEAVGVTYPDGARLVQDAVRRGLVIAVPIDADPAALATFLLRATAVLTQRETSGRWTATLWT